MMKYRAVFFDRDGTLTAYDPEKEAWRDRMISSWSGHPFVWTYDRMMSLFRQAGEGRTPWYRDVPEEQAFFRRFYRLLLREEGVTVDCGRRADELFDGLWCRDRILYPETVEVLEYFRTRGFRMGVISDTSPSLEYSLQCVGLASYFTSFTASSLVGAGKPDPRIYHAALKAQGVTAEESLYVDDCEEEADGARVLGFTAFHLCRQDPEPHGNEKKHWQLRDLRGLVEYAERCEPV